jgi:ATP-dependent helicase HepA
VLEAVADSRWHVEQFLAPQPVRVVVDFSGGDLTDERDAVALAGDAVDGTIQRWLERPGFNAKLLRTMLDAARELAEGKGRAVKSAAAAQAAAALTAEWQRLVDLRQVNDHVRPEEVELAREQLRRTREAIDQARLRLDSLRLVVEAASN